MADSRTRVLLLLAITFVAGVAAGFVAHQQLTDSATAEQGVAAGTQRGTTIERFADELGLTAEQRAEIAPIVAETRLEMSALFEPVRPAYDAVVDSARSRIEAILTDEQVAQYRVLLKRHYGDRQSTD